MRLRTSLASVVSFLLVVAGSAGAQYATVGSLQPLDPAFSALVPADAKIEKLAEGFSWSEGPVWRKSGGYLLFSDIPRNTIFRWQEGKGISVFMRPAGYGGPTPAGRELGSNGLTIDMHDALVMADHGNRQIARVVDSNTTKITLADRYEGKRLNSPNDLTYHSNGDLYFTDPPYGLHGNNGDPAKELPFNGVLSADTCGQAHTADARSFVPKRHHPVAGRENALCRDLRSRPSNVDGVRRAR
jgi:gluconolactonase